MAKVELLTQDFVRLIEVISNDGLFDPANFHSTAVARPVREFAVAVGRRSVSEAARTRALQQLARRAPRRHAGGHRAGSPAAALRPFPARSERRSRGARRHAPALRSSIEEVTNRSARRYGFRSSALPVIGTNRTGSTARFSSLPARFSQQDQLLRARRPHRNDHPPALLELVDQRLRHVIRRARHDDRIERRRLRPALVAIARAHVDVAIAEPLQDPRAARFAERLHDLDRIHLRHRAARAPPPGSPSPCRSPARDPSGFGASFSVMNATMYGCEIVCSCRSAAADPRRRAPASPPARTRAAAPAPSPRSRADAHLATLPRNLFRDHLFARGGEVRCARRRLRVARGPGELEQRHQHEQPTAHLATIATRGGRASVENGTAPLA